ncbi:unnamed protein product [Caenorhabditis auriculariae]|uniref:Potassium channel domain-containing protein n=1 Tax=Caenorhabditis auriculariae TaxID=2777116 RepID=A0A8S1GUT4_9PELO|nr:unnamed protein product [Caenorhabditis auriculariae]
MLIEKKSLFQRAKPFTLHCSLLMLVLAYAFFGGFVFNRIESEAHQKMKRDERISRTKCVSAVSYNRIAPITYTGRMFCIVYGICGIPVTMIIIANVGQYLNNFAGDSRRRIEAYRQQRRMSKASLTGKVYKESSIQVTSLVLLCAFLVYVTVGALLLPALNGEVDFFNGLYFNFLCLTAIDFGQLVPIRVEFLPITFVYVCIGLAITTIAINIGSEYMKKLHYWGKKMKNAAQTKIWFGGKTLKVRDLLHAVGKKCGVEPSVIDALDLENVVERTIAMQEGRTPPDDVNEEPPSPRSVIHSPCSARKISKPPPSPRSPDNEKQLFTRPSVKKVSRPELIIKKPVFATLSNEHQVQSAQEKHFTPFDFCQLEINPETVVEDVCEGVVIIEPPRALEDIMVQPLSPLQLRGRSPSIGKDEKIPKCFKEKKEMYGRDPRKLYETYQEEWERLERISDRKYLPISGHGSRRRSVLNLAHMSPERGESSSPLPPFNHSENEN